MKRTVLLAVSVLLVACGLVSAQGSGAKTLEALKKAYIISTNAKAKYDVFAAKADAEGYKSVASLLRAMSKSEELRSAAHEKMISELGGEPEVLDEAIEAGDTKQNLEIAVKLEASDKPASYEALAKQAEADGSPSTAAAFRRTAGLGKMNSELLKVAKDDLDSWKVFGREFLVCTQCQNVVFNAEMMSCPVCSAKRSASVNVR